MNKIKSGLTFIIGLVLSVIILVSPICVHAQSETVMPSGLKASDMAVLIDEIVTGTSEEISLNAAGGAIRITVNGESLYMKDFGYADKENNIAVTEETVFEWGTVSQLLIWVSVLQLAEDGTINMQENIANYLPEGDLKDELEPMAISMENLMNYTSGLQDNLSERYVSPNVEYSSLAETLSDTIPEHIYATGSVVAQSDWPCALAAYVVEYMSGVSYAEYVKENIFIPLEMEHTALLPDLSDNEWVMNARKTVKSYQGDIMIPNSVYCMPMYPAGMVTGTMDDFHCFANELLLQDETSRLFDKKETAETLFDTTLNYTESDEARIAHGMFIYRFGQDVYGMKGNSMTQMAVVYMEPETRTCLTYMTNEFNEMTLLNSLEEIVFGAPQYEVESDLSGLRVYEGTYVLGNSIIDGRLQFTSVLGALYVTLNEEKQLVLPMLNDEVLLSFVDDSHAVMGNGELANIHAYPDGTTVIMTPNQDYVTYSTFKYFAQVAIFFIMLLAYFYSSVALVIALFEFVMRKINKDERKKDKFYKYHVIQCLNTTVFGLYFAYMAIMSMSYAPMSLVKTASIMFWLGSVMSVIYLLFFWKTGRNEAVEQKTKIFYWATAVSSVVTVAFAALFGLIL